MGAAPHIPEWDTAAPRVVGFGIDTLWLYWRAPISDKQLRDLAELQQLGKGQREGGWKTVELGGQRLVVRPHGGSDGSSFLLTNDAMAVKLNNNPMPGLPTIQIELRSLWLWQRGPRNAVGDAQRVVEDLVPDATPIHPRSLEAHVTRLDLCADFQGWVPTLEELLLGGEENEAGALRCRADKSRMHLSKRQGCSGADYGVKSSEISAGIYDKTREIQDASGKDWFKQVWALSGEKYVESEPVWRLEYRLKREGITGFQIIGNDGKKRQMDTWADVLEALPSLWRKLTGNWLVRRGERTSSSRQTIAPSWLKFFELDADLLHKEAPTVLRRRGVKAGASIMPQLVGYCASLLAYVNWRRPAGSAALTWAIVESWMRDELERDASARGKSIDFRGAEKLAKTLTLSEDAPPQAPAVPTELEDFHKLDPEQWRQAAAIAYATRPDSADELAARIDRLHWANAPKVPSRAEIERRELLLNPAGRISEEEAQQIRRASG